MPFPVSGLHLPVTVPCFTIVAVGFSFGLSHVSVQMTGMLQFAIRQGVETESYMTSTERIAEYALIGTEPDVLKNEEDDSGATAKYTITKKGGSVEVRF